MTTEDRVALEERRAQIQSAVNVQTRFKRTPKLSFMADPAVASGEPSRRSSVARTMTTNNGLLLVDKPQGLTSHDVVARVRRILHEKKVGHAGTLDPMATGLLVLAVGPSTRLLRFAQSETKRYSGAVKSASPRTHSTPTVSSWKSVRCPSTSAPASTPPPRCSGRREQIPPWCRRVRIEGQRLHELARRGRRGGANAARRSP